MTLDEAKVLAREVLENKTRSHVQSARDLALFVLKLRTIGIELPADPSPLVPINADRRQPSFDGWDESEIKKEVAPWPSTNPKP